MMLGILMAELCCWLRSSEMPEPAAVELDMLAGRVYMLGNSREQAAEPASRVDMQVRCKIQFSKCIQGVQHLARRKPGITHDYVGKLFFFADRSHLIDWGRPIFGDRYVAMEHGPVPVTIYSIITNSADVSEEIRVEFQSRLSRKMHGELVKLWSNEQESEFPGLSGSDIEYLDDSFDKYGDWDFGQLIELSRRDEAYQKAMERKRGNKDLNPIDWLGDLGTPAQIVDALYDMGVIDRNYGVKHDVH